METKKLTIENFYMGGINFKTATFPNFSMAINMLAVEVVNKNNKDYLTAGINYKKEGMPCSCDLVVSSDGKVKISKDYKTILSDYKEQIEALINRQKPYLYHTFEDRIEL